MITCIEWVNSLEWENNCLLDQPASLDRSHKSQADSICEQLFVKSYLANFNLDNECRSRLESFDPKPDLIGLRQLEKCLSHPYAKAVVLECIHEVLPRGKDKRDAAVEASEHYERAIEAFSQKVSPIDYWICAVDSIERSKVLSIRFGRIESRFLEAALEYSKKIQSTVPLRIYSQIGVAALRNIKTDTHLQTQIEDLYKFIWQQMCNLRHDLALLAKDMVPFSTRANMPGFREECAQVMLELGATLATCGLAPLVATTAIYEAARFARSCAGTLMPILMKLQELIYSSTIETLDKRMLAHETIDPSVFQPLVTMLQTSESRENALMLLGATHLFGSFKETVLKEAAIKASGCELVNLLCHFQALGHHGPVSSSVEDVAVSQETDIALFRLSMYLRSCLYQNEITKDMFAPSLLCRFLVDSQVVSFRQQQILLRALTCWFNRDFVTANFMLVPLMENAFMRACSLLGDSSLVISRTESTSRKTGESIAASIETFLGADWAFIYMHLWGKEGASRHAYCHGYIVDNMVTNIESDVSIYCLIVLAYSVIIKQHDIAVQSKAYEIWEQKGKVRGNDWSNWFEAESLLFPEL